MTITERLFAYLAERHPRSVRGVEEARAVDPLRFAAIAERMLGWAERAREGDAIAACADAFARFSSDVNLAQARYEVDGAYPHKTHAECEAELYGQPQMADYLWGVYLTNFLWPHHLELSMWFEDRFVAALPEGARIVELAPGHGGWGLTALHARADATLVGYDISPSSIAIATKLAEAAGVGARAQYRRADATQLAVTADAAICCFLLEHLEQPQRVFEVLAAALPPKGRAFVTGALTAAQVDHIFELRHESELCLLAERAGFRVVETRSLAPLRTLPRAKFLPRSMGLLVERTPETSR